MSFTVHNVSAMNNKENNGQKRPSKAPTHRPQISLLNLQALLQQIVTAQQSNSANNGQPQSLAPESTMIPSMLAATVEQSHAAQEDQQVWTSIATAIPSPETSPMRYPHRGIFCPHNTPMHSYTNTQIYGAIPALGQETVTSMHPNNQNEPSSNSMRASHHSRINAASNYNTITPDNSLIEPSSSDSDRGGRSIFRSSHVRATRNQIMGSPASIFDHMRNTNMAARSESASAYASAQSEAIHSQSVGTFIPDHAHAAPRRIEMAVQMAAQPNNMVHGTAVQADSTQATAPAAPMVDAWVTPAMAATPLPEAQTNFLSNLRACLISVFCCCFSHSVTQTHH